MLNHHLISKKSYKFAFYVRGRAAKYILLSRTATRINRKFPLRNVQEHFFPSNYFVTLLPCTKGTSGTDFLQPWSGMFRFCQHRMKTATHVFYRVPRPIRLKKVFASLLRRKSLQRVRVMKTTLSINCMHHSSMNTPDSLDPTQITLFPLFENRPLIFFQKKSSPSFFLKKSLCPLSKFMGYPGRDHRQGTEIFSRKKKDFFQRKFQTNFSQNPAQVPGKI